MSKFVKISEARDLYNKASDLQNKLAEIANKEFKLKQQLQSQIDEEISRETAELMKGVSINELAREQKGLRIKPLADSGYNSIYDIIVADPYYLQSVKGVSIESARQILAIANNYFNRAKNEAKLKLNLDKISKSKSQLIYLLVKLSLLNNVIKANSEIINDYKIRALLDKLKARTGFFRWLFTSRQKKFEAQESYGILSGILKSEYGTRAYKIIDDVDRVESISQNDAIHIFESDPIHTINTLEEIAPNVISNGDTTYGLPDDLISEVKEVDLNIDGLKCSLRRYQVLGVKYILHQKKVLLGDEMGLGKTIQAIATMVALSNSGLKRFLVVCPASVLSNWCREIIRTSNFKPIKIHGNDKYQSLDYWIQNGGVAVTTYDMLDYFNFERNFKYDLLVVDEAHYIKNPLSKRHYNVLKLTKHTNRLLFMTGTALENRVDEMKEIISMLNPAVYESIRGLEFLSKAPEFREKVVPVYYRRKREDVLTELPELIETKEWLALTSEEEEKYEETLFSGNLMTPRRVSWNIDDISCSSKANRMLEIIDEATQDGRKIIVFSFFLDTINKIVALLGDKCIEPISGSVSPERRQEIIDQFEAAPAGTVLVSQIIVGGTGLNIQAASVVIICEPQLKPSTENQAISRAYRMGQVRNVIVYRLLSENTIDERIDELLTRKQEVFNAFADKANASIEDINLEGNTYNNLVKQEIERIKQIKDISQLPEAFG